MGGISFIIPAYNEEKSIAKCVRSILDECERFSRDEMLDGLISDFEIIVVDNNSTDRTYVEAALVATEDSRSMCPISVVFESQKGVTRARQRGADFARYQYHAYIDADNIVPPNWLDNIVQLVENPNIAVVSGPLYFSDMSLPVKAGAAGFYIMNIVANMIIGPTLQGGNFILKRKYLTAAGGHSTNIPFYGEDTDLARRLSNFGSVRLIPAMWIYSSSRRLREQGIFNTTLAYVKNYLAVTGGREVTREYEDFRPD